MLITGFDDKRMLFFSLQVEVENHVGRSSSEEKTIVTSGIKTIVTSGLLPITYPVHIISEGCGV